MLSATEQQEATLHELQHIKHFFLSLFISSTGLVMSPTFLMQHLRILAGGVVLTIVAKTLLVQQPDAVLSECVVPVGQVLLRKSMLSLWWHELKGCNASHVLTRAAQHCLLHHEQYSQPELATWACVPPVLSCIFLSSGCSIDMHSIVHLDPPCRLYMLVPATGPLH